MLILENQLQIETIWSFIYIEKCIYQDYILHKLINFVFSSFLQNVTIRYIIYKFDRCNWRHQSSSRLKADTFHIGLLLFHIYTSLIKKLHKAFKNVWRERTEHYKILQRRLFHTRMHLLFRVFTLLDENLPQHFQCFCALGIIIFSTYSRFFLLWFITLFV